DDEATLREKRRRRLFSNKLGHAPCSMYQSPLPTAEEEPMHRNLAELARTEHDLLIIGGGAAGAAAAREATLRGLRVALIERHDFGSGASAHCFKVVHGGIRYLQHADVRRLRSTSHERSVFLRLAPHLVKPLPFVIPTYGMGRRSRWFLG